MDFCLKDITAEDSGEHLASFTSPWLSTEIQPAYSELISLIYLEIKCSLQRLVFIIFEM